MSERERIVREEIHHAPVQHHVHSSPQHPAAHDYVREEVHHAPVYDYDHVVHEEVVASPAVTHVDYHEHVVPSAAELRLAKLARMRQLIYFIASAFAMLILFRFVLLMLGANPENTFANLVYAISYPLVAPFLGLFGNEPQYGGSVLEFPDLVAIAVYYLLAWAIVKILTLVYAPPDPTGRVYE